MRLVLYEPDIPQNLGAAIRLCACLGVGLDIVEPCGFLLNDRSIKRASMDYAQSALVTHHNSWEAFKAYRARDLSPKSRLILFTTKSAAPYTQFQFQHDDMIMMGRESAGVPQSVHDYVDHRLFIPIAIETRSINVINAASMALGEALRQTNGFPIRPDLAKGEI